jgi:hypothetical protein
MTALVRYDAMCHAIAAAYKIDEVKDIRDKALALQRYAQQAKNVEAERQACEIRLRAERRAGRLLAAKEKAKRGPAKASGQGSQRVTSDHETLADLGVSKKQSSDWQKLATVPEEQFEKAVKSDRPTTTGIIAAHVPAREKPKDKVDPKALWLWGNLLDFERQGLLAADPNELLAATMLEHMKVTTLELAPLIAAWLGRIGK